ncbi:hypothetical protein GCM10023238_32640 [Streptomyces heliomycini]
MATTDTRAQAPGRSAVVLALRLYGRELSRLRRLALPAMLLPAVGNIGIRYVAPLLVAKLAGQAADDDGLALAPALPTCWASARRCCSPRPCGGSGSTA